MPNVEMKYEERHTIYYYVDGRVVTETLNGEYCIWPKRFDMDRNKLLTDMRVEAMNELRQ